MVLTHIIVASPSNGEIAFRCDCDDEEVVDMGPLAGVLLTELAGVICGVIGGPGSTFGLAMVAAPRARV
jgi:hypothetical protein